jgi:hypothetical protein
MRHDIETAALQEAAAEQTRATAEAAWRRAWWETTLALAEPAEPDKRAVMDALDTAQRILGQSRSWLARRRAAGRHFSILEDAQIWALPPRLAVEYTDAHGDPAQAVEYLTAAEAQGASLRDVAADLGTQPKSWLRENEQDQRPVTAEQIRAALADQALADEVFRLGPDAGDATRAARRATEQAYANSAREMAERRERAERDEQAERNARTGLRYLDVEDDLVKAKRLLANAAKIVAVVNWTDEEREFLAHDIAQVRAALGLLEAALSGVSGEDWDAALAKVTAP